MAASMWSWPSGRTTYTWDYENQNIRVELPDGARVTISYNADFRRVTKDNSHAEKIHEWHCRLLGNDLRPVRFRCELPPFPLTWPLCFRAGLRCADHWATWTDLRPEPSLVYHGEKIQTPIHFLDPVGTTVYQLDSLGNVIQETDPLSHTTQYTYDALNRKTKVTNAVDKDVTSKTSIFFDVLSDFLSVEGARFRYY